MAQFRKKPVVIEAVTWNGEYGSPGEWPPWFNQSLYGGPLTILDNGKLQVRTRELTMIGDIGDKIIKGIDGEIYPWKPDIFAATYEPA